MTNILDTVDRDYHARMAALLERGPLPTGAPDNVDPALRAHWADEDREQERFERQMP